MAPDAFRGHVIFDLASPLLRYANPGHLAFSISTHCACLISLFTPAPRSTQQTSQRLRRPCYLVGAGCALFILSSPKVRGAERRKALQLPRLRGVTHPLRSGSSPLGAPLAGVLVSAPGRAFFRTFPDRQRAPRGRLVVASRAEPRRRPSACLRSTPAGAAPNENRDFPGTGRRRVLDRISDPPLRPAPPPRSPLEGAPHEQGGSIMDRNSYGAKDYFPELHCEIEADMRTRSFERAVSDRMFPICSINGNEIRLGPTDLRARKANEWVPNQ